VPGSNPLFFEIGSHTFVWLTLDHDLPELLGLQVYATTPNPYLFLIYLNIFNESICVPFLVVALGIA
jgi:hypothetical protein